MEYLLLFWDYLNPQGPSGPQSGNNLYFNGKFSIYSADEVKNHTAYLEILYVFIPFILLYLH